MTNFQEAWLDTLLTSSFGVTNFQSNHTSVLIPAHIFQSSLMRMCQGRRFRGGGLELPPTFFPIIVKKSHIKLIIGKCFNFHDNKFKISELECFNSVNMDKIMRFNFAKIFLAHRPQPWWGLLQYLAPPTQNILLRPCSSSILQMQIQIFKNDYLLLFEHSLTKKKNQNQVHIIFTVNT